MSGPFYFLLSNLLVCISLSSLRQIGLTPFVQIILLALSNFVIYLLLIAKTKSGKFYFSTMKENIHLITWSMGYTFIYGSYLAFPQHLKLSHLILIKSITPLLAVFFSGDFKKEKKDFKFVLNQIFPLVILFLIVFLESHTGLGIPNYALFLLIGLSFIVNQTGARALTHSQNSFVITQRFSFLNFLMLSFFILLFWRDFSLEPFKMITASLLFGVMIISLQYFYFEGLRKTKPYLSSLFISSSVPMTLTWDYFMSGKDVSLYSLALGFLYLAVIGFKASLRN